MKKNCITKFALIMLGLILSAFSINAINTSFLIDVSGSMNGLSNDRTVQSFEKVNEELYAFLKKNKRDTIQIIAFTDKVIDSFSILPDSGNIEAIVKTISYPRKGNTNINKALKYLDSSKLQRLIIVSDGRHNIGSNTEIIEYLSSNNTRMQYFLLLDESDMKTPLLKELSNTSYIKIIRSLTELAERESSTIASDSIIHTQTHIVQTSHPVVNLNKEDEKNTNFKLGNFLFWIVIIIIIILCGYVIGKFLITISPLFTMASAGAIQSAIAFLYNLPRPIYNVVFNRLPSKMIKFLQENMPKYENLKRGEVVPNNEVQRQTLKDWQEQTGKKARYKNGEIDFSDVSEHREKLNGSLDDNIPNTPNPRSKVSKAQDEASHQMLNSKIGRDKIGKYVGKSPNDVTYEDYTCWKDDAHNQGTPYHNPKTPHETIDGKEIMWVPKKYHDVAWGGIDHYGGVSMLKSIRNYFGLKI